MSRKGNCWDNAVAESFFKILKYECTNKVKFNNTQQLKEELNQYINWYNTQRIHSELNYKTPLEKYAQINKINYKNVAQLCSIPFCGRSTKACPNIQIIS